MACNARMMWLIGWLTFVSFSDETNEHAVSLCLKDSLLSFSTLDPVYGNLFPILKAIMAAFSIT